MTSSNPIHWLDNFVMININPGINTRGSVLKVCNANTKNQIKQEVSTIKTTIKDRTFSMSKDSQLELYIANLHRSFEVLLAQIEKYKQFKVYQNRAFISILDILHYEVVGLHHFIELWYPKYLKKLESYTSEPQSWYSKKFPDKVVCSLTGDQVALILRAADESKFLVARSMRSVFQAIAPYLATPHRKALSYDSLRLKAYIVSEKNKEVVIEQLNSIIKKIEKY